ncbi:hypothetical protein ACX800_15445 [Paenarthrobacter nitroguajacolicus]|uniref:hypothetical protein n=1 Tax=Paenarthrobacter nitroguajacolicus TaxID=211146 RepID=UPI003D1FE05F
MDVHLQPDWQRALGQYVVIRRHGKFVRSGTVAAVTPDGSIVWISAEGASQRQMFVGDEGYEVYSRYSWDPQPASSQTYQMRNGASPVDGSAGGS